MAGGAEKALEPAAYHRCGGGGQERLYGKPITQKVPWPGERGTHKYINAIPPIQGGGYDKAWFG